MLDSIHSLIEDYKTHQFILTGSSARKLRRGGVNLLAGRALLTHLHPFMAAELGADFSLDAALRKGLIPLVVSANEPEKALAAYVALYLKEEVKEEGLVRDIGTFARFLEIISFSHGSVLNLSNMARECQVSRKIVENYLSVIEDLLIGYKLPVFTRRAKRAMTAQPKFFCSMRASITTCAPGDLLTVLMKSVAWPWKDWSYSISRHGVIIPRHRQTAISGDLAVGRKWISSCMERVSFRP